MNKEIGIDIGDDLYNISEEAIIRGLKLYTHQMIQIKRLSEELEVSSEQILDIMSNSKQRLDKNFEEICEDILAENKSPSKEVVNISRKLKYSSHKFCDRFVGRKR